MFCEVGHHQSRPKINGGGGEGAAGFSSGLKLGAIPAGNPERARLLSNSENCEHMKNFSKSKS